jgi:ferrous iron transport protein A
MRNRSKTRRAALPPTSANAGMPLSALRPGEQGVVVELSGGRGLLGRMASLGFTPGAEVTVVQNFGRGPLIARVRDARIALGRGEAGRIRVRRRSP